MARCGRIRLLSPRHNKASVISPRRCLDSDSDDVVAVKALTAPVDRFEATRPHTRSGGAPGSGSGVEGELPVVAPPPSPASSALTSNDGKALVDRVGSKGMRSRSRSSTMRGSAAPCIATV